MERFYGVEEARGHLGRLVEEVASTGEHVALTKRGKALAVIVSRDEYAQLRQLMAERARSELATRLATVRRQVEDLGLDPEVVDLAIDAARRAE
jgi:prevent-host-death family protein